MPRVSRRKSVLEMIDTNIRAQTIFDAIFESDEEDVQSASDGECYQDQILKKVMKTMG